MQENKSLPFCKSLFQYQRNKTTPVRVGTLTIGGDAPVSIQSMTTTNTMNTEATANQIVRIVETGGELVRITTQGRREAENLKAIKELLKEKGCYVPLVADVHFNPNAAEVAASLVEKVRINPGNFAGGAKKFRHIEVSPEENAAEVQRIRALLIPLLDLCKKHGTAIRIGTNHGSLSDRIMSRYGDTPRGMVQSCLEYLRICREEDFHDIVLSIKSSNTRVMVHTVRLLVATMNREGMHYPLHLGVTEAGSGEDGRLKSVVGIGALLADGIGDTLRVSLTEAPEMEIPVARKLVEYMAQRQNHATIRPVDTTHYHPFDYHKRTSHPVLNVGGDQPAAVLTDLRGRVTFEPPQETPDLVLCQSTHQVLPDHWNEVVRVLPYKETDAGRLSGAIPFFDASAHTEWLTSNGPSLLQISYPQLTSKIVAALKQKQDTILLLSSQHSNGAAEQRAFFLTLETERLTHPVIVHRSYQETSHESLQVKAGSDTGLLLLDGFGDGICITAPHQSVSKITTLQFGILQAARVRFSKTEYISCPGCGRTLFDLQKTTAEVQAKTAHLKNLKIAIMGCIVNGIGEMADADYGYVGAGANRISLYRNRELVKRNIPQANAVAELVQLIKEHDDWTEP